MAYTHKKNSASILKCRKPKCEIKQSSKKKTHIYAYLNYINTIDQKWDLEIYFVKSYHQTSLIRLVTRKLFSLKK